jgi:WD40 repeat protein
MASLFISHSSRDRATATWVAERLHAEGFLALFLDFDPAQGLPAGRNWERELYAQLRKTDAVIFLASAAAAASQWCFAEISLARSLGRPVFPLRLERGVRLALLDDVQWVDLNEGKQAFVRLRAGLRQAGLDSADAFSWDPTRSPYPGLESFDPEDAAVFFGRHQDTSRLLELLQPTLQRGPGRFVAIVGPSGSGKSSLLRAGLLPRLGRLPSRWVLLPVLRPGQQPTHNLARSLAGAFAARGHQRPLAELTARLDQGAGGLVELAVELAELEENSRRSNVLVVIDQAEELVTRSGAHEQQAFLGLLRGALGDHSPLWVLAAVRSEFLSTAPERAGLAEAIDDPLVIEPLSRTRLPEVIERPAERAGLEFAPGLVERMLEETAGGDALPLLAYTLRELSHRAGPDGRVTIADYEALGGVVGALQRRADRLVDELGRRGQSQLVIPTLLKLVTVQGEGEPTSRRLRRSALGVDEQAVIDAFVDARLLTSDRAEGKVQEEATVEVAHEALLRQWQPLREAIEAARAWLGLRSELERLAADWDQGRRDESYLLRGARLGTFERWADEHVEELSPLERQFLEASQVLVSRELDAVRRSNRRLRLLAGGLVVLLVVAMAAAGLAVKQTQQAQQQTRLALSRQLTAQAPSQRLDRWLLLSLQATRIDKNSQEARSALVSGLQRSSRLIRFLQGDAGATQPLRGQDAFATQLPDALISVNNSSNFSPNGSMFASGIESNAVTLWDVRSGQHLRTLTGHQNRVIAITFSSDGKTLASASSDGTATLWDVHSGRLLTKPLKPLRKGRNFVTSLAFSSDGRMLAQAMFDRTIVLWDVRSGRGLRTLTGQRDLVTSMAFSPDGTSLASASQDGKVTIWDARSGRRQTTLSGHVAQVLIVAFSPDGATLASGSADRTIILWDPHSGRRLHTLTGHLAGLRSLAFSPDGTMLASGGGDRTVILWRVRSGQRASTLTGHDDTVRSLAFSPDGTMLASASGDRTVILWRVDSGRQFGDPLTGHSDSAQVVAFSPDGTMLASGSGDRTVILWDPRSGRRLRTLTGHHDRVQGLAFSPDGTMLASGSNDRTVILWDPRSGRRLRTLTRHHSSVTSLAFSPSGTELASGSADKTIIVWEPQSGRRLRTLTGHEASIRSVAFSSDHSALASASNDQTIIVWDVASGRRLLRLTGHLGRVTSVAFSPDGTVLASGSADRTIILWDPHSGRRLHTLTGHLAQVRSVAFSPDGTALASGSADRTISFWESRSGRRLATLSGHVGIVRSVAFSRDGSSLASGSDDGAVILWDGDVSTASWQRRACHIANRNLSRAEWDQYIGPDVPYQDTCP